MDLRTLETERERERDASYQSLGLTSTFFFFFRFYVIFTPISTLDAQDTTVYGHITVLDLVTFSKTGQKIRASYFDSYAKLPPNNVLNALKDSNIKSTCVAVNNVKIQGKKSIDCASFLPM